MNSKMSKHVCLFITFVNFSTLLFLYRCAKACDENEMKLITDIKTQIKDKENVFFDMEAYLPKKNGYVLFYNSVITDNWFVEFRSHIYIFCFFVLRLYLNLVLGNVNVTLLSNQAKYVNILP